MAATTNTQIATEFLEAWSGGDFDAARAAMDDGITFRGPMGETEGADAYVEGVRRLTEIVKGVDIQATVAEGNAVCIRYDLITTVAGPIPTVGWYAIRDGKVASVDAYFDPRPMLG